MSKHQQVLSVRHLRVISGGERKAAVRKHLQSAGVDMTAEAHTLSAEHAQLVAAVAKAVGYRKPAASQLSVGVAYFVYLSREGQS